MTECVHGARRISGDRIGRRQQRAGGSERDEGRAGADRADADGARGIVAGAAGEHRPPGHAPALRQFVAGAAPTARSPRPVAAPGCATGRSRRARRRDQSRRAASSHSVPGRIRDILDRFAREHQPQIGFRQQHQPGSGEDLRLVFGDPQQLRRREAGHRLVAGRRAQNWPALLQLGAFRSRPPVIPEDAGPQRLQTGIEQRGAVHLARQADADDVGQFGRMIRLQRIQRREGGINPLRRILFAISPIAATPPSAARLRLVTTRCAASTRTVLTAEVPRSIPRYMVPRGYPTGSL